MIYAVAQKANIRNIQDIHAEFLTFIKNEQDIEIDLDGCDDADISLVQMIEAARKTAAASGKKISLTKPANTTVEATLARAGLIEGFTGDDAMFWLQRERV